MTIKKMLSSCLKVFNVDEGMDPHHSHYDAAAHEFFRIYQVKDLLPYELYNEEYGIYIHAAHTGFCLELAPIVGSSEGVENDLQFLVNEVFEESAYVQWLLWADPNVGAVLDPWQQARMGRGAMLEQLAKRRTDYFRSSISEGRGMPPRTFRCFLSYSVGIDAANPLQSQQLNTLKERVIKTLERHTHVHSVLPEGLIDVVRSMVYPFLRHSVQRTVCGTPSRLLKIKLHR